MLIVLSSDDKPLMLSKLALLSIERRMGEMMDLENGCSDVCTFSLGEKLIVRSSFFVGVAIGAYGMWLANAWLAVGYLLYAAVGYSLLMRYTVCSRCPHVLVANDCLFIPASLVRAFVAKRTGELLGWEKGILLCAVIGTAGLPLYWLLSDITLLSVYLLSTIGCFVVLYLRMCKRKCQVVVCPLNGRRGEGLL